MNAGKNLTYFILQLQLQTGQTATAWFCATVRAELHLSPFHSVRYGMSETQKILVNRLTTGVSDPGTGTDSSLKRI